MKDLQWGLKVPIVSPLVKIIVGSFFYYYEISKQKGKDKLSSTSSERLN